MCIRGASRARRKGHTAGAARYQERYAIPPQAPDRLRGGPDAPGRTGRHAARLRLTRRRRCAAHCEPSPIDPVDGTIGSSVRVGTDSIDIAAGLDALWVANLEDGTISRIDAGTRLVETIQIGSPVAAIAVDESSRSPWIVIAIRP